MLFLKTFFKNLKRIVAEHAGLNSSFDHGLSDLWEMGGLPFSRLARGKAQDYPSYFTDEKVKAQ